MSHLLKDHKLPGIGPGRIRRLQAAGLNSLEELVEAGAHTVGFFGVGWGNPFVHIPITIVIETVASFEALRVNGGVLVITTAPAPRAASSPWSDCTWAPRR